MEGLPRWIEVGAARDPVNFIALLPLEEVARVLREDGWGEPRVQHAAALEGRRPAVTLERPLLSALVRLHARLWADGTVVGNAHLDVPALAPPRHVAFHDVGKACLMYAFYRRGYAVELVHLANECENHDGRALKVYSRRAGGRP
ncbi:MAG: hypothetical protein LM577_07270 [Thermoproteaceae archaeon]|nr:hypothetical protein [Thermoproteaceae archaeon]